jgi:hypothetical protein
VPEKAALSFREKCTERNKPAEMPTGYYPDARRLSRLSQRKSLLSVGDGQLAQSHLFAQFSGALRNLTDIANRRAPAERPISNAAETSR